MPPLQISVGNHDLKAVKLLVEAGAILPCRVFPTSTPQWLREIKRSRAGQSGLDTAASVKSLLSDKTGIGVISDVCDDAATTRLPCPNCFSYRQNFCKQFNTRGYVIFDTPATSFDTAW
jgi:hypothetical protein